MRVLRHVVSLDLLCDSALLLEAVVLLCDDGVLVSHRLYAAFAFLDLGHVKVLRAVAIDAGDEPLLTSSE